MIQKILGKLLNFITFDTLIAYLKKKFWNIENASQLIFWIAEIITKTTDTPIDNKVLTEFEPHISLYINKLKNNTNLKVEDKVVITGELIENFGKALKNSVI